MREAKGGSQSAAAELVSRCCMSPRPMNFHRERQKKFGFISTCCIDLVLFCICGASGLRKHLMAPR